VLPIEAILPGLRDALACGSSAVVVAAPGAGKTTLIPLALRDAPWLAGKRIVMLEPRRLAARMAATRMAALVGDGLGETVGYRVRLDSRVSARTRVEVVTEGILTRRLQRDPELGDIGLLIFDEFHERSLDADLGLALALDVQRALRPDLKIVVMSATLDGAGVAKLLGEAPVIEAPHRPYPVATRYLDKARSGKSVGADLARDMASLIRRAADEEAGSMLAFLPGEAEIRKTHALLEDLPGCVVAPLYGALSAAEQQRAIDPAPPGRRKIVLATTIAETSLTIEGVRIVVDCGFKRAPRFNVRRGMSELTTVRVSRASAEQRRGRAGRLEPGVCYRLWTAPEDLALAAFDEPEIAIADLAPLVLDLAAWGVNDPLSLSWLTPPPSAAYAQGAALLLRLDALDGEGRITGEGRAMAALPLHPRLAHMVERGAALGFGGLASDIAALLSERDILRSRDPDLRSRLDAFSGRAGDVSVSALARVKATANQIRRIARIQDEGSRAAAGMVLALAYPDRVAEQRSPGRYRLSGGGGAMLDPAEPLAAAAYLAVADRDADGRIFLAAPLTAAEIETAFGPDIVTAEEVVWDDRQGAVAARRQRRLGNAVLEERPLAKPNADAVLAAVLDGVRKRGLQALPWNEGTESLRARVAFLRGARPNDGWPDLSDGALLATLDTWLAPFLAGITRVSDFTKIDLDEALKTHLPWPLPAKLDEHAPTHIAVPSGSRIAVQYLPAGPALHVKLQEVFGLTATPQVAGVPVTLHLLSPAQRPIAVTADLTSFWRNVYPEVRGEMRGRYPRHIWPEDPFTATPVRKSIKPRGT
jgi:ATP-dependent helicase HrpB